MSEMVPQSGTELVRYDVLAPFRTFTKRQLAIWLIAAVIIALLDNIGLHELDLIDTLPPEKGTWFDLFCVFTGLLVTLPMMLAKFVVAFPFIWAFSIVINCTGTDLDSISGPSALTFWTANFCFDLFVCFLVFGIARLIKHRWNFQRQRYPAMFGLD